MFEVLLRISIHFERTQDRNARFFFYLIFLFSCYYAEHLLGGWSVSSDDSLKSECLDKALVHLNGAEINQKIREEASNVVCRTQIVNGLNIKCTFTFRGKKHRCSFYKSFIQTLETQLEQCKEIIDESPDLKRAAEDTNEKEDEEQPLIAEERDEEQEEQATSTTESNKDDADGEKDDDEAAIDELQEKLSDQAENKEEEEPKPEQME